MEIKLESETYCGNNTVKRYDVMEGTILEGTLEDACHDGYDHEYTAIKGGTSLGSFTEQSEALATLNPS